MVWECTAGISALAGGSSACKLEVCARETSAQVTLLEGSRQCRGDSETESCSDRTHSTTPECTRETLGPRAKPTRSIVDNGEVCIGVVKVQEALANHTQQHRRGWEASVRLKGRLTGPTRHHGDAR